MAHGAITAGTPAAANNNTVTPANPTHASGDTLLCVAFVRSDTATLSCATAGWTAADGITNPVSLGTDGTNDCRAYFFQNECDSASESDPAVTISGGANGVTVMAVVLRLEDRDFAGNFVLGTVSDNASSAATIEFDQDSPSIDNGNAILALGFHRDDYLTIAGFSNQTAGLTWTTQTEFETLQGADASMFVYSAINDSGSAYTAGTAARISGSWSGNASNWGVYLESIGSSAAAQNLDPPLFTNSQTFHAPTVGATYSLAPSLLTNAQTFHAPTVEPGTVDLAPPLLTNEQTFYAASVFVGQSIEPPLVTNDQTFYGPTVAPGAVDLAPSLLTNAQTFHAATVSSLYTLSPPLLTNAQSFPAATVTPGAVDLAPSLLDNSTGSERVTSGTFDSTSGWSVSSGSSLTLVGGRGRVTKITAGSGTVSVLQTLTGLTVGRQYRISGESFAGTASSREIAVTGGASTLASAVDGNIDTIFVANATNVSIALRITASAATNQYADFDNISLKETHFFASEIANVYALTAPLLTNSQTFYAATVEATNPLSPSLLTNDQTFYAATLTPGAIDLAPSLLSNSQSFYAATVALTQTLQPSLFTNAQTFYSPTVEPGAVTLFPPLLTNSQSFPAATVTTSYTLTAPLVTNGQTFYGPTVASVHVIAPPLVYSTGPPPASTGAQVTVATI